MRKASRLYQKNCSLSLFIEQTVPSRTGFSKLIHFIHFAENLGRDFASLKFPLPRLPHKRIPNLPLPCPFVSSQTGIIIVYLQAKTQQL